MTLSPRLPFISAVAYFRQRPERIVDLLKVVLVQTRELIGDRRVRFCLSDSRPDDEWNLGVDTKAHPRREFSAKLSSDQQISQLRTMAVPHFRALWQSARWSRFDDHKIEEWVWELDYEPRPIAFGLRLPPSLIWSLNADWLREHRPDCDLSAFMMAFFRAVNEITVCASGFCDVADFWETYGGEYFSCVGFSVTCPDRAMERYRWIMAGESRARKFTRVRWANYMPREATRRMGGAATLLKSYRALEGVSTEVGLARLRAANAPPQMIERAKLRRAETGLSHRYSDDSILTLLTHQWQYFCYPFHSSDETILKRELFLRTKLAAAGLLV